MKIVNYIRGRALNHRLFLQLCQDVSQNDNHVLLYDTEVRWLSRGWVLKRFLQLRKEIKRFLEDRNSDLLVFFESVEFIQMPAYLADIFHHLNDLNLSRGRKVEVCEELRKKIIDVCCMQEVRWKGQKVCFVDTLGQRYKL